MVELQLSEIARGAMVVRYAEDMNDTFTTVVAKRQIDPEGKSEKDGSYYRL